MKIETMDFDEDDFIFIESDAPAENLNPSTPTKPGRKPAFAKRTPITEDAEPSTSKPKLKRSFRSSPEVPGPEAAVQARPGKRRKKGADPDSEEERWLDALEEGKLEQVDDELKKIRNPLLMTARQRAMLEKRSGEDSLESFPAEPLVALPSGYREKSEMTAEMAERHKKKTERRREQAKKHREEEKKKTVRRLLNKTECKTGRGGGRPRSRAAPPSVTYRQTVAGAELLLPAGQPCPLVARPPRDPPKPRLCDVPGCRNLRRYGCPRSGASLCSLQCFRANAARLASPQITTS